MPYVKHSIRTHRKGCQYCGEKNVYWFHNTDDASGQDYCKDDLNPDGTMKREGCYVTGRFVFVNADAYTRSLPHRGEIVGDPTPYLHSTTCTGERPNPKPAPVAEAPVPAPEMPAPAASEPTPAVPAPTSSPDLMAAMQTLMGLMGPQVDESTIRRMVDERFDSVVFPHTHTHHRENREPVEITGSHVRLPDVIGDLADGEHVMMVGPAGTGKSTLAEHAANALGIAFRPMSICAQTTEARFFGFVNANTYIRTAMRDCWEYGGLLLIDEIDKGNPNIVSVLNAAMSNDYLTFPDGETIKRHPDFIIVATANTYGRGADHRYVGSNKLDAATLDRFTVETIGYDEAVETAMCMATGLNDSGGRFTVDMVLSSVRAMRNVALSSPNTQAIVSPRASVGICKKLARGRSWDDAFETSLFKGMSKDDRAKLTVS